MTHSLKRRGFTLIEALVVLATAAVLIGLVAPAVLHARDDARRRTCKNNLKQLALAIHNYHDTHFTMPPAWTAAHWKAGAGPRYGWMVFILPFMDRKNVYDQFDFSRQFEKGRGLEELTKRIDSYRCPGDPTSDRNPWRDGYATSNYSANFGSVAPPRWIPGRRSRGWPGQADTPNKTNGLFWANSSMRMRDITSGDGTVNTFMLGERGVASYAGIWAGVGDNAFEYDAVTDCSPGNGINSGTASFSSMHKGGAHFALCDASVRFVSDKIASAKPGEKPKLYQHLSTRNGGERIRDDF